MQKAKEQASARRVLQALGKRVERLRFEIKGCNRTTLAKKAGVTVATVRACETGRKVTQPDKLSAIAKALGVSVKRLEADDTKDPRLKNWSDEDYEIGLWYHHAPRALKNRIWALQEVGGAGVALTDPQFVALLEAWTKLTPDQKNFVLNSFHFVQKQLDKQTDSDDDTGGVDALAPADSKTRGPQR